MAKRYKIIQSHLSNSFIAKSFLIIFCAAVLLPSIATARNYSSDTALVRKLFMDAHLLETDAPDSAFKLTAKAEQLSRENDYYFGIGASLQRKASVFEHQSAYDSALSYYHAAVPYFIQSVIRGEGNPVTHWKEGLVGVFSNCGNIYTSLGDFDKALSNLHFALELAENTDHDTITIINVYNNISSSYMMMLQYDNSMKYLQMALRLLEKKKDNGSLGTTYINMASVSLSLRNYKACADYIEKARKIGQLTHDKFLNHTVYNMLGALNLGLKKLSESTYFYERAVELARQCDADAYCTSLLSLGTVYFTEKNWPKAEKTILDALKIAQKYRFRNLALYAYNFLYPLYYEQKRYKEAVDRQEDFIQLKDSIRNEKNIEIVNQLDAKYRSTLKDKEIAQKQKLIAQQHANLIRKNIWIFFISGGIVLVLTLLFFRHRIYTYRQREQLQKIKVLETGKKIEILQASIKAEELERSRIAHDIHDGTSGMLSVVKMRFSALQHANEALLSSLDFKSTMQLLDEAINDLRNTAHNLAPEALLDSGLMHAILSFCEHINKTGKLHIAIQAYGDFEHVDPDVQLMIFRMTQELIHNILKHAQASQALLQISLWENLLSITAEDNGTGFPSGKVVRKGMGLKNIEAKVEALNGIFNVRNNDQAGCTVYLEFDVQHMMKRDV